MQYLLTDPGFQNLLARSDINRLDKLLLILFWNSESAKAQSEIKLIAQNNGLRECSRWNVSDILGKSKGKAISIKEKWTLSTAGRAHLIEQKYLQGKGSLAQKDAADLRSKLVSLTNANTHSFIEEAIACLESDLNRAAVVLSWVGAISILYDEIVRNHLAAFNAEAVKRDAKWKVAKNADDIGKMKEFDFLNILEAISVIGKNVKQELQNCLQLRNGCGHPNSLKIGERKVAAHIETLILNVFSKF